MRIRRGKEERRQQEKEARSREEMREKAYQETQQGVYARIYEEQEALPEDAPEGAAPDEEAPSSEELQKAVRKRKRRRRIGATVALVLLGVVFGAFAAHTALVRPPELPEPVKAEPEAEQEEAGGIRPNAFGADRREDVYTFLLVGRDDGGGGNTDTIMVGCYDVKNGGVDLLSIYRDTLVDVPWEIKKINSVFNRQGIEGLQEEIRDLIGYTPDYYFVLEMSAMAELVDVLGGVDYEIPYNMDYDDPTQDLHIHFQKGMQHVGGEDAVKILRWRKNNSGERLSVGDVGRVELQHSFLSALADQGISLGNLTKIRQIAAIVDKNITSSLSYGEMLWFGERALRLDRENIRFHSLPGDFTGTIWSPTYQNYQSYVFVNEGALLELVNTYMNPYVEPITADMQHIIYGTDVTSEITLPSGGGATIQPGVVTEQQDSGRLELPTGQTRVAPAPPAQTDVPSVTTWPSQTSRGTNNATTNTTTETPEDSGGGEGPVPTPAGSVGENDGPSGSGGSGNSAGSGSGGSGNTSGGSGDNSGEAVQPGEASQAAPTPAEPVQPTPAAPDPVPTPASPDPTPTPAAPSPAPTPASPDPAPTPAAPTPAPTPAAPDPAPQSAAPSPQSAAPAEQAE